MNFFEQLDLMQERYDHPYYGEITLYKSREDGK